jgi:hypothetical protein
MAKRQVLNKIARNLDMLGLTVTRSGDDVVVANASNALTVSYVDASIMAPMGGIDGSASPFLGIGIANPGKIRIKSSSTAADAITDVLDSVIAAKVFHAVSALANNIILENSDATFSTEIRGNVDNVGLGQ